MTTPTNDKSARWHGLRSSARAVLGQRDYSHLPLSEKIASLGVEVGQAISGEEEIRSASAWIPGVELFSRKIYPQLHRGIFGELGRSGEGITARLGLTLTQWSAARMFAGTSKGFHIHPPFIPEGYTPAQWFQFLFDSKDQERFSRRHYDKEQWDVMYFLQGRVEILLVDEREGLPRRIMRVLIEGDNHRGNNNAGVIIPPGVAHAIHVEGTEDVITVYGTSTTFDQENEGRIACEVERAILPSSWKKYLGNIGE